MQGGEGSVARIVMMMEQRGGKKKATGRSTGRNEDCDNGGGKDVTDADDQVSVSVCLPAEPRKDYKLLNFFFFL